VVGEAWVVQVEPSLVRTIVPLAPTAQAAFVVGAATPKSSLVVGDVWAAQVAPELIVFRITPPVPTAQAIDPFGVVAALTASVGKRGFWRPH
jgi:hypothetical protein